MTNPLFRKELIKLKDSQALKTLAVCEVTGLAIELSIPSTTAILSYKNPLADIKNCLSLVEKEENLLKLPTDILAGIFLAIVKKRGILDSQSSKLSAIEQNLILQEASKRVLVDAITLFARITKEQAILAVRFVLDSQLLVEGKSFSVDSFLLNKIAITRAMLFGEAYLDSSRTVVLTSFNSVSSNNSNNSKVLKSAVGATIKGEVKDLIAKLEAEELASSKVIKILKLSIAGNNLLSLFAQGGLGEKLISVLNSYDSEIAAELADKLSSIQKNLTIRDRTEQLFTTDMDRVSDASISKPKRTLKEILAAQKNKNQEQSQELKSTEAPKVLKVLKVLKAIATDEEVSRLESILDSSKEEEEEEFETTIFAKPLPTPFETILFANSNPAPEAPGEDDDF